VRPHSVRAGDTDSRARRPPFPTCLWPFATCAAVNRLAHWLLAQGLQRGDTIALYLPNKPAYPIIWLACLAIDVLRPSFFPQSRRA